MSALPRSLRRRDIAALILGGLLALGAVVLLEAARFGLTTTDFRIGTTPVSRTARADADGPPVVIAHGFAGSRQIMQAYAQSLAQAGYVAYSFDLLGHGRNPVPMSGDVSRIDGTTRLLVDQIREVIEATAIEGRETALLGHSMATDLLVRSAKPQTGPLVLLSAYSRAITPEMPRDLLLVTGAWEPGLRDFAREAVRMIDPEARIGETVTRGDLRRRAEIVAQTDHVSILHAPTAQRATLDWLDGYYGRSSSEVTLWPTGWALIALLGSIVLLAAPLARLLPQRPEIGRPRLGGAQVAALALCPALVAPLVAVTLDPQWLPVLVADYLALHLLIFAGVQLFLLRRFGVPFGALSGLGTALLMIWGLGVFGLALDRYGTNFWPDAQRLWIIAALSLGAVPFMLADALAAQGAPFWQRLALRLGFLGSLGLAVALDFSGLFFLLMIAPVIVLFYLVFGAMGRFVARRRGPAASGLALGVILAWALGVSFPLFSP